MTRPDPAPVALVVMHPAAARVWRPASREVGVELDDTLRRNEWREVRHGPELDRYNAARARGLTPAQAHAEAVGA